MIDAACNTDRIIISCRVINGSQRRPPCRERLAHVRARECRGTREKCGRSGRVPVQDSACQKAPLEKPFSRRALHCTPASSFIFARALWLPSPSLTRPRLAFRHVALLCCQKIEFLRGLDTYRRRESKREDPLNGRIRRLRKNLRLTINELGYRFVERERPGPLNNRKRSRSEAKKKEKK